MDNTGVIFQAWNQTTHVVNLCDRHRPTLLNVMLPLAGFIENCSYLALLVMNLIVFAAEYSDTHSEKQAKGYLGQANSFIFGGLYHCFLAFNMLYFCVCCLVISE